MRKAKQRNFRKNVPLIFGVVSFAALYLAGAHLVWRNTKLTIQVQDQIFSNEAVRDAIRQELFYDSVFFRTAAAKLEYAGHDPAVLRRAYQLSVMKNPANSENLLSFGIYAASRRELDQAENLFTEAVRRFPTDPLIPANAGIVLYRSGNHDSAMSFFIEALRIDPGLSYDIYPVISKYGGEMEELIRITPVQPDAVVHLCRYVVSRYSDVSDRLEPLIRSALAMQMQPEQRLQIATCAMNARLFLPAREEAEKLRDDPTLNRKADELLQEIDRKERKNSRR